MSSSQRANTKDRGLPESEDLLQDILDRRGWDLRDGQHQMSLNVWETIEDHDEVQGLVVSAPVGTGKTLGYLTGALPHGHHVLVCTSTKALQDQIVGDELPRLSEDLKELYGYDLTYSVLKGKSNYVCVERVEEILEGIIDDDDPDLFALQSSGEITDGDKETLTKIQDRVNAAIENQDTSLMDCSDLMEDLHHALRAAIRSSRGCSGCRRKWWTTADEGGGYEPEDGGDSFSLDDDEEDPKMPLDVNVVLAESGCAYRTAVALAFKADVVVMNTSLLAADLNKSRSVGPFTPTMIRGAGVIIVDEAHHLPDIITGSMRHSLDFASLEKDVDALAKRISKRLDESTPKSIMERLESLPVEVRQAHESADQITDDHGNKISRRKVTEVLHRLSREIRTTTSLVTMEVDRLRPSGKLSEKDARTISKSLYNLGSDCREVVDISANHLSQVSEDDEDVYDVTWNVNEETGDLGIETVPLDLSFFQGDLQRHATYRNSFLQHEWSTRGEATSTTVLCSGTITARVGDMMGLTEDVADFVKCTSPFDPLRCALCIPGDLAYPNDPEWFHEASEYAIQAIRAVGGKTLFLTTSNSNLARFHERLVEEMGDEFTILSQSSGMTREQLISAFKEDENSILVATRSYWEGIDVPGRALSLVIMDKCMFPMPDDPVIRARTKWVEKQGRNAFSEVSVGDASIMFAQGFGRAIRKSEDIAGVLSLDSRIVDKSYGTKILSIVEPDTPKTVQIAPFLEWLRFINDNPEAQELPEMDPSIWERTRPRKKKRKTSGFNRYRR